MNVPFLRHSEDVPEDSHLLGDHEKETGHTTVKSIQSWDPLSLRSAGFLQGLTVKSVLLLFVPSFIQNHLYPNPKVSKQHPTAFLDGMRGLAALMVFIYHFSGCTYDVLSAYGHEGKHHDLLRLPFIRFFYSGPAMVSIFYVVSGYALSYKPVRLMRSKSWSELMRTIASSIFRRAIRLYLPCIVSTLMIVVLIRMDGYNWGREFATHNKHFNTHHISRAKRFDTLSQQLHEWAREMWIFIHPFSFGTKDTDIKLDGHLWTIPMEFRSSLVLYLTQAGLACLRPLVRVFVLLALITWVTFKDRWELILFYAGFLLAELGARQVAALVSTGILTGPTTIMKSSRLKIWNAIYIFTFLIGMYLCAQPVFGFEKSPGWRTLGFLTPSFVQYRHRYWPGWGAILMVWATSNMIALQKIFTNSPVQYLGRISFSLYIMHGPVTHSIGYAVMDLFYGSFGWETALSKAGGFGAAGLITLMVTIWSADMFMRAVDTPSVKFAKWLEERCSVTP
jgi:peptidoglycan/LPS O-acetylase OafA/YrhL